ncbi:MAG: hypothetical protein ACRD0U_12690 [Acidimicrobiales bacterium]
MTDVVVLGYVFCRTMATAVARRLGGERGEGVVSTAIAVLIMAFLGALMWIGFKEIWLDAKDHTQTQVGEIGK